MLPSRERDRWGCGLYYQDLADGVLAENLQFGSEWGGEVFYNVAVTSWMNLTLDAQIIDSALPQVGTVVVLGTRVGIRF